MRASTRSMKLPRPDYLDAPNPFDLPPDQDLFQKRDSENQRMKEYKNHLSRQTLIQRSSLSKSPLYGAGLTISKSKRMNNESASEFYIAPPAPEHQRREQMHEFVEQKREIFLVQLLIDRKNKEIDRISQTRKTEKKNIADEEAKIAETTNQYKMSRNQIDAELTRGKKSMEDAIKKRTEISKQLKKMRANVSVIESEITKNEYMLESYRNYADFLKKLAPPNTEPMDVFKDPKQVLDELEKVEMDNLFLIQHCAELTEERENGLTHLNAEIDKTVAEKSSIEESMSKMKQVEEFTGPETIKSTSLDTTLANLTRSVRKAYMECFKVNADISPLAMLERIEIGLEKMYTQSTTIDPKFLTERQSLRDKKRREEQRLAANKKKLEDQKKKAEAALARAKKPIKRRTGRPLNERVLPIKLKHTVDDKAKLEEEKAIDDFLFGEIVY